MGLLKPLRPNVLQKMIDTIEDVHFCEIKIYYIKFSKSFSVAREKQHI